MKKIIVLLLFFTLLFANGCSSDKNDEPIASSTENAPEIIEETETKECFALAGERSLALALAKEWFSSSVEWEFEGITVKVPAGWNEWLKLRYGDYRKVPIGELQGEKTLSFITLNANRPYTDYKGKTYCVHQMGRKAGKEGV